LLKKKLNVNTREVMAEDLKVERKELDLYDIIDLIWKNKFKIFVAPIILSLISFIYFDSPKRLFY
tara:strand:- start:656 stop:850 length:195 start_codon:yes stop_codon:yes gene_type:complete